MQANPGITSHLVTIYDGGREVGMVRNHAQPVLSACPNGACAAVDAWPMRFEGSFGDEAWPRVQ